MSNQEKFDWICSFCDSVNFGHRTKCYKCSKIKPGVSEENIKATIMVRGIAGLTYEDLQISFSRLGRVKEIRMIKDRFTGEFKEFAFVEFESEEESSKVIYLSQSETIRVSGRPVSVVKSKDRRLETSQSEEKPENVRTQNVKPIEVKEAIGKTENLESVGEIFMSSMHKNNKNKDEFLDVWTERLKGNIAVCFRCCRWFDSVEIGKQHDICHK